MSNNDKPNETMPRFWWLNPWLHALRWKRRAENSLASGIQTAEKYAELHKEVKSLRSETLAQSATINQLHMELSKTGESVAWWKSSADSSHKTAKEQVGLRRVAEEELGNYKAANESMKTDLDRVSAERDRFRACQVDALAKVQRLESQLAEERMNRAIWPANPLGVAEMESYVYDAPAKPKRKRKPKAKAKTTKKKGGRK